MFGPELVITEPRNTGICNYGGGYEGENASGKEPEVGNIEQRLGFTDYHITAENYRPAADCNRQVVNGVRLKRSNANQPPVIGHFRNHHNKCHNIADVYFRFKVAYFVAKTVDKQYKNYCKNNGCKMRYRKICKFNRITFTKKVFKELFHFFLSLKCVL